MPSTDIRDSTAIVPGASRGFGRGIAEGLSRAGVQVVGVARNDTQLQEVHAELGDSFIPISADAADPTVAAQLAVRLSARVRSSGEFTQAVIHVTDARAAVEEMRGRGAEFEEYDTPETRSENGVAAMPDGGEAAWFKYSEGNLVGVVPA